MLSEPFLSAGNNHEISWRHLLGHEAHKANFCPGISFCVDPAGVVQVLGDRRKVRDNERMRQSLTQLFGPHEEIWRHDEREQAIGSIETASLPRRVLLLCRAQLYARRLERHLKTKRTVKYLRLADGQITNLHLFWPPSQVRMLKGPLTRIPETLILTALIDVARQAVSSSAWKAWTDAKFEEELLIWLRKHGATEQWLAGDETAPSDLSVNHLRGGFANCWRHFLQVENSQTPRRKRDFIAFLEQLINGASHVAP